MHIHPRAHIYTRKPKTELRPYSPVIVSFKQLDFCVVKTFLRKCSLFPEMVLKCLVKVNSLSDEL